MKIKKIEEKIIKKIYQIETKKTFFDLFLRILFILLFLFSSFIFFLVLVDVLKEQNSFDLLDFLRDDFEVIQKYFYSNLVVFYNELPKELILFLIINIILLLLLTIVFFKNFKKIKNKIKSIYKFFKK